MDPRDDLAGLINDKISGLSSGINEKINNAALQTKVVIDLSSAVRVHLQKMSHVANSGADPAAALEAIQGAIQGLSSALQNEEARVKENYSMLKARKLVLAEVSEVVKEQVDSHTHWLEKKKELQQRHLEGEDLSKVKRGQRPESIRDIRNAISELNTEPDSEETNLTSRPEQENVQIHEPEVLQDSLHAGHVELPAKPVDEPQEEQEPPQHVSRFFSGE
tara:strand:- start:113 stop:772 length:660 start_codon:yes stop_codon:yes gene_type:complete